MIYGILIVLCLGMASGFTSDLKESYQPKETMIVGFSGIVEEPITASEIIFKRANVQVPVEYDVKKIGERYYLWAVAPENENNYTLIIKDRYEKTFAVSGNLSEYYVKPGMVVADKDFEVKVYLNSDNGITISSDFPLGREIYLEPGENTVRFSHSKDKGGRIIALQLGKYILPVQLLGEGGYIPSNATNLTNQTIGASLSREVIVVPSKIRAVVLEGGERAYPFVLVNPGERSLENVYLNYDRNIFTIEPDARLNVGGNSTQSYNLMFDRKSNESINTTVNIRYGDKTLALRVEASFTSNPDNQHTTYTGGSSPLVSCISLGGVVCGASQICLTQTVTSSDGPCCTDKCQVVGGNSGGGSWIGYIVALLVLAGIAGVWYWHSRKKPNTSMIQRKFAEAEKKMP